MTSLKKIENPTEFRRNIRAELAAAKLRSDEEAATNVEIGIFNWAVEEANRRRVVRKWDNPAFLVLYIDRLRSIWMNLTPSIVAAILSGELAPHTVAFMTHQELAPAQWEPLIRAKIERDRHKYDVDIAAATDTFTCRKCKSNKCTYYQMQCRSADEPMTTFVQCIPCGNRWKC